MRVTPQARENTQNNSGFPAHASLGKLRRASRVSHHHYMSLMRLRFCLSALELFVTEYTASAPGAPGNCARGFTVSILALYGLAFVMHRLAAANAQLDLDPAAFEIDAQRNN